MLTELRGPLAPLATRIEGSWSFEPAGTGTQVTWTWRAQPRTAWAKPALAGFATIWGGYARQALEELSALLVD